MTLHISCILVSKRAAADNLNKTEHPKESLASLNRIAPNHSAALPLFRCQKSKANPGRIAFVGVQPYLKVSLAAAGKLDRSQSHATPTIKLGVPSSILAVLYMGHHKHQVGWWVLYHRFRRVPHVVPGDLAGIDHLTAVFPVWQLLQLDCWLSDLVCNSQYGPNEQQTTHHEISSRALWYRRMRKLKDCG